LGEIINVKDIVEKRKILIKERIERLKREEGITPKLAVIIANSEESSRVYVGRKRKMCESLGILEEEYEFSEKITTEDVLKEIERLNNYDTVNGILVQLPLFKHLDTSKILKAVSPTKDVDGFHPENFGNLIQGNGKIAPCTPKGVMTILKEIGVDVEGKDAVVVGRSVIVGRPMAAMLTNEGATVTICHSKTKDLISHTKRADILIVAVGVPHLIKENMVKENSIVIDVGINKVDGKLVGDVDTKNVIKIAKSVTPVPGGVGLTTVHTLMENLIDLTETL